MRIIFLLLMAATLSSCAGHDTLKAPCAPIAGIAGSPCSRLPINLAPINGAPINLQTPDLASL